VLPIFVVLETLKAILHARSCIPHGTPKRNTAAAAGVWHPAVVSATPAQRDNTRPVFIFRIKKNCLIRKTFSCLPDQCSSLVCVCRSATYGIQSVFHFLYMCPNSRQLQLPLALLCKLHLCLRSMFIFTADSLTK
jgi:hypothetical protein